MMSSDPAITNIVCPVVIPSIGVTTPMKTDITPPMSGPA